MSQPSTEPEYTLEHPLVKTRHMVSKLDYTSPTLLSLVVDLEVLSRELKQLATMSTRIKDSLFVARSSQVEVD